MKPIVHGLEAEYWGRIDFIYLDREAPANAEIVARFRVIYQPVLILLNPDATEAQRWYYGDPDELRAAFDAYLAAQGG